MDDIHKSSEVKTNAMKKHLDYMLKNNAELECPILPGAYVDSVGGSQNLPMPASFNDITYDHVTNFSFVGKVVSFFGNHACKYYNPQNGLLDYESATGYLSSFKSYFTLKYKCLDCIKPFDDKMWSRYRSKLRMFKVAQAVANNKLLSCPKKAANDDDRWSMFGMCVWGNTTSGALFLALMSILFQVGGRVSEGSTVNKSNFKCQVS